MKIRLFVSCSAIFLAAWLGVTFWRSVPYETYRQSGRGSLPISASVEHDRGNDRQLAKDFGNEPEVSGEDKEEVDLVMAVD